MNLTCLAAIIWDLCRAIHWDHVLRFTEARVSGTLIPGPQGAPVTRNVQGCLGRRPIGQARSMHGLGRPGPRCSTPTATADVTSVETVCLEGQPNGVQAALMCMDQQGVVPAVRTYEKLLQACMKKQALADAKWVHAHLAKHGLECNRFLGELLVRTLVNCGGIVEGLDVFQRLPSRTVFSWTAIISGCSNAGHSRQALTWYRQMQSEGVRPNNYTFVALLKACSRLRDLQEGQQMHVDAVRHGFGSDVYVGNALVSMYAQCRSLNAARLAFDRLLSQRDLVSWNAMLAAYAQQEQGQEALKIYQQMQKEGVKTDARTFVSALQACGSVADQEGSVFVDGEGVKVESLQIGRKLHAEARRSGFLSNIYVGNALVSMYSKCGSITNAHQVFEGLHQRNVVSWNAMLAAYAQQGEGAKALHIFWQMCDEGFQPNVRTFVSALQACGSLAEKEAITGVAGENVKVESLRIGRRIHGRARERGFESDVFVGSTLVSMYAKCGSIKDAQEVFDGLSQHNVVSWTALITAYAQQEQGDRALKIYEQMQEEGVEANTWTFVSALQACSCLGEKEDCGFIHGQKLKIQSLERGRKIHAAAIRKGCDSDAFVGSALVSMYAKCGSTTDAEEVFDGLAERDLAAWNSMVAAYAEQDDGEKALQVFWQMQRHGLRPVARTFVSALQACGRIAGKHSELVDGQVVRVDSLKLGKEVHADAVIMGFGSDIFVGNTLVTMYAKCGSMTDAEQVFKTLSNRDAVSWTAMIAAYAQQERGGDRALQLYVEMQAAGVKSHEATFLSVLEACSNTGALDICVRTHQSIVENGLETSPSVTTRLIHAYSKCGSMVDAQKVFDSLPQPGLMAWNALITGHARLGGYSATIPFYERMCAAGLKPDGVTFLALLSACSHAGMVDEGLRLFDSMASVHGISAELEHYGCAMDLVGRAGMFSRAEELLSQMPMQPDLAIWLSLLGACQKHGNVQLGRRAFHGAITVEPKHAAAYVLMSNIYADVAMWERASEIHELRQHAFAWKKPGLSWIQHEEEVHTFLVDDLRHGQTPALYGLLNNLSTQLQKAGYVPKTCGTPGRARAH